MMGTAHTGKGEPMMRNDLIKDMENMENCMIRLGGRTDIWQDRMIYVICKAVFDLCRWAIRREQRDAKD